MLGLWQLVATGAGPALAGSVCPALAGCGGVGAGAEAGTEAGAGVGVAFPGSGPRKVGAPCAGAGLSAQLDKFPIVPSPLLCRAKALPGPVADRMPAFIVPLVTGCPAISSCWAQTLAIQLCQLSFPCLYCSQRYLMDSRQTACPENGKKFWALKKSPGLPSPKHRAVQPQDYAAKFL